MISNARERIVREEAGFTLPEVVVSMVLMVVVLSALYSIFDMSMRVFTFGNDKVEATEQARLGMEKMEREIRAAYPVDRINGEQHVFFPSDSADPATSTPTLPEEQSITFGNDLPPSAGVAPNRMVDPEEAITYALTCPSPLPEAPPEGVCTVFRQEGSGGTFEPLVESVVPDGLTFEYLRNNLTPIDSANEGTDIGVVRITLEVNVGSVESGDEDGVEQTLTTDVDLRNRGG